MKIYTVLKYRSDNDGTITDRDVIGEVFFLADDVFNENAIFATLKAHGYLDIPRPQIFINNRDPIFITVQHGLKFLLGLRLDGNG